MPNSVREDRTPPRWIAAVVLSLIAALAVGAGLGLLAKPLLAQTRNGEAEAVLKRLKLPDGFKVNHYAAVDDPRFMVLAPGGDILVSVPAGEIVRVRADKDGDGKADGIEAVLEGLDNPSGLHLDGDTLYVAEETRVIRVGYDAASGKASGKPETVFDGMPSGGHSTRTIKKGPDGAFYITVGSSCNVCVEKHPWRAAMLKMEPGGEPKVFATGLRNTVGFDWKPGTGEIYGGDNGRDRLGDDIPVEDVNRITEGGFYGWPFYYGDNVPDPEYGKRADKGVEPVAPVHGMMAHTAPLSLKFLKASKAQGYENAALVAQHGSWNRSKKSGYQVVSLHFGEDGKITERPFLTGFMEDEDVVGRPVDIVEAPDGTLFVSDDYGGALWRITRDG